MISRGDQAQETFVMAAEGPGLVAARDSLISRPPSGGRSIVGHAEPRFWLLMSPNCGAPRRGVLGAGLAAERAPTRNGAPVGWSPRPGSGAEHQLEPALLELRVLEAPLHLVGAPSCSGGRSRRTLRSRWPPPTSCPTSCRSCHQRGPWPRKRSSTAAFARARLSRARFGQCFPRLRTAGRAPSARTAAC
jgi:hypothetical protein